MSDPVKSAISYQADLFRILEEFFTRVTGKAANVYSTIEGFSRTIKVDEHSFVNRYPEAMEWFVPKMLDLYAKRGEDAFTSASGLGGHKLVLGGGSRFMESQLRAVVTTSLYSDTVLVPDPIMPWLEKRRDEEKFPLIRLLQTAHCLLHLKPLVDASTPYPSVMVFPSWEKYLEGNDEQTKEGQRQLAASVFSFALGRSFGTFDEALDYVDSNPQGFLHAVELSNLLVAPNGAIGEPLARAVQRYEEYIRQWRSDSWVEQYSSLPMHRQVINAIVERVGPLYHILENAEELGSHPLIAIEQQAHYFKLVCAAGNDRLLKVGLLEPKTRAIVEALGHERLSWMRNIPLESIARLKQDGATIEFRNRLGTAVSRLHESSLDDTDHVAAEVCHEIADMVVAHDKQQRDLNQKYARAHGTTAALSVAAVGAAFMPALAPFVGTTVPFALAAKYGKEKWDEAAEKRALGRSLTGVLAFARDKSD